MKNVDLIKFHFFLLCFVSTKSLDFTLNFRIIILGLCRIISSWTGYWTRFGPLSDQIILVKSRACSQSDRILQAAQQTILLDTQGREESERAPNSPSSPVARVFLRPQIRRTLAHLGSRRSWSSRGMCSSWSLLEELGD